MYDQHSRSMYDVLMGGIGLYYYADGQLTEDTSLPCTDNVTSLVQAADGVRSRNTS